MLSQTPTLMAAGPSAEPSQQARGSGLVRWRQALRAAGLSGLQRSNGPLTFLAPTDAAFDALLREQSLRWADLCGDTARLVPLLLGHVLPTVLAAPQLQPGHLRALGQAVIRVDLRNGGCGLTDAHLRRARLLPGAVNGQGPLVHRIDRVLLPPTLSLMQQLWALPDLREFAGLLERSGAASLLKGQGPFTVFAPSQPGLARLAARLGLRQRALSQQPALLMATLSHHLVPGRWLSSELPWGDSLASASGRQLALAPLGLIGTGDAAQALLPFSDLLASNGVIHRIAQPLS